MNSELVSTLGKYLIASLVLVGCFVLLYTANATDTQPWTVIGLIVGWIVRDSAGTSATSNLVKAQAATQAPAIDPTTGTH